MEQPKNYRTEVRSRGDGAEQYRSALDAVVAELETISQLEGLDGSFDESRTVPVNGVSSEVTVVIDNQTWTVTTAPQAGTAISVYRFDGQGNVTLKLSKAGQESSTETLPHDVSGAGSLSYLLGVLMDFLDAGDATKS